MITDGQIIILVAIYVPDLIITCVEKQSIQRLEAEIKQHFEMSSLPELYYLLGMEV